MSFVGSCFTALYRSSSRVERHHRLTLTHIHRLARGAQAQAPRGSGVRVGAMWCDADRDGILPTPLKCIAEAKDVRCEFLHSNLCSSSDKLFLGAPAVKSCRRLICAFKIFIAVQSPIQQMSTHIISMAVSETALQITNNTYAPLASVNRSSQKGFD